jgi:hypothetical protein
LLRQASFKGLRVDKDPNNIVREDRQGGTTPDEGLQEEQSLAAWRAVSLPPLPLRDGVLIVGGNGDFHRYGP